jgi:VanZ family protein
MSEGFRNATTRTILLWIVWFLYVGAWTAALLTPHPAKIAVAVLPEDDTRFYVLKTVHVLAYLVLTVLTGFLRGPRPWRWLLLLFLSAHALGTEYFQRFVPLREGSWRDVGLDHIGICLGLLLSWRWWLVASAEVAANAAPGSRAVKAKEDSTTPVAGPPV